MNRLYLYIMIVQLLVLSSCGNRVRLDIDSETNRILYGSIIIESDSSWYELTDYLPAINGIDSITSGSAEIVYIYGEGGRFQINLDTHSPSLGVVEFWRDGTPTSLLYQRVENISSGMRLYSLKARLGRLHLGFTTRPDKVFALWQNSVIPATSIKINDKHIIVKLPKGLSEKSRSYLRVYASKGDSIFSDVLLPMYNDRIIHSAKSLKREDPHRQIIYSLMIDRFNNGDVSNDKPLNSKDVLEIVDYMGGDLIGITEKIKSGFFKNLGVTTIWLSPITQNPYDAWGLNQNPKTKFSGYHGYWPIYTTVVDERFGTEDDLRELLDVAHENDINVILDYVANHLHIDSPLLKENPDWITPLMLPDGRENIALWDEHRLTTWFDKHIPTLDLERDDINEIMTDSALYWIDNFDFDGFRHDATKHIPRKYWRMLTHKMRTRFPDRSIYQIGETYGSPELINSYVRSGLLDAQFDFNLYDKATWNLGTTVGSMIDLNNELLHSLQSYGSHNLMGNITSNHDRPRFISLAGGSLLWDEDSKAAGWQREITVGDTTSYDRLLLLNTFMLTIPGVPVIYQGDEYGVPGGNDPDNRHMMQFTGYNSWESRNVDMVSRLTHYRLSSMPLLYGDYLPLKVTKECLVYARIYLGDVVIVVINRSIIPQEITFKAPNVNNDALYSLVPKVHRRSSTVYMINDTATMSLSALSFEVYHMR